MFADHMFERSTLTARRMREEEIGNMRPRIMKESVMARRTLHDEQLQAYHEREMDESAAFYPNRATVPRCSQLSGW